MTARWLRAVAVVALCSAFVAASPERARGAAAGATVSGTVSGSDQGFLTGATVAIEAAPRRETRTDADGRFTLTDIPSGTHRFLISADGYLPLDRTIDVGTVSISVDVVLLKLPGVP
jgi:hypothetical protein